MRNTFNIKDARDDLKLLNDFLVELGQEVQSNQAHYAQVEELMNDPEFSRLMKNIRFFQVDGNKFLSEIYESKARNYAQEAHK